MKEKDIPKNLRVVISCVTFETVKVVDPAVHIKADLVYILHKGIKPPYNQFVDEVQRQLEENGINYESEMVDIFRFQPLMSRLIEIIRDEKSKGNNIYMNIGAGSTMFTAAGLIASMMEGCMTFNVGTKEHMVDDYSIYFDGDKPVGLAKSVHDPFPLPNFRLEKPDQEQVETFKTWKKFTERRGFRKTKDLIIELEKNGIMEGVKDDNGRVKHSSVMEFRRYYLDNWINNGWIERSKKGKYRITDQGKMIINIFG